MRVALFSDTYTPYINGVAVSVQVLKNELEKHGHEVYVVTAEAPSDSDYVDDGPNIIRLPGIKLKKIYGYRMCNVFSLKGMNELRKADLDVIHVNTEFGVGQFGRLAAEILNLPVVYTYHTMYEDYTHYISGSKLEVLDPLLKRITNAFSRFNGDMCTELIVPSGKTKEALERYGITKNMHVIPTGLELEKFDRKALNLARQIEIKEECNIKDGQFVLVFVGRIAKEKGLDVVLDGVKVAKDLGANFKFICVGGGPYLDELKDIATKLDINDFVCFTDKKPNTEVPNYYHASSTFVSASQTETQGLTFIEAMASGLPVLARHDENLDDVVLEGRNGYYFEDAEDLGNRIYEMSKSDLTEISSKAYEDSKQYSSETFYESVISVYYDSIQHKYYDYKITSVFPVGNQTYECSFKHDNHELTLILPESTVQGYELIKGKIIDRVTLDELKDFESSLTAFKKALRYLTVKDYTEFEMRQKLAKNVEFTKLHIDHAIDSLKLRNLINDRQYALDYMNRSAYFHLGFHKAMYNLRKKGISDEILELCKENYSAEVELEDAVELVRKWYKGNKNKSVNLLVKSIRERLFYQGYSTDVIDKALNNFNFYSEFNKELDILDKEYTKAYKRFSGKYEGTELKNKIVTYLIRKGFDYSDIQEVGRGMKDEHDD